MLVHFCKAAFLSLGLLFLCFSCKVSSQSPSSDTKNTQAVTETSEAQSRIVIKPIVLLIQDIKDLQNTSKADFKCYITDNTKQNKPYNEYCILNYSSISLSKENKQMLDNTLTAVLSPIEGLPNR